MATFNKFQCFAGDVGLKKHDLNADTIKVYLTNAAPNAATHTVYNTPADLATSGGYTAGGIDTLNTYSQTGGTGTCAGTTAVFTATTGFGPFQYALIYNDTAAAKNLIGWWDYGSAVTLAASETFTVTIGASMFTLA